MARTALGATHRVGGPLSQPFAITAPNPDGTLRAVVEQTASCLTFTLAPEPGVTRTIRAVRVSEAPLDLAPGELSIVWFPEGDGAALCAGEQIHAVLPSWAGTQEEPGYSSHVTESTPYAQPLAHATALQRRVAAARAFWGEADPFGRVRDGHLAAIHDQLGETDRYFAIDNKTWPPRALVTCPKPPGLVAVTVGMSLRRQPEAECHVTDGLGVRIELAMALHGNIGDPGPWLRRLATLAALPWREVLWFGAGHTVGGALPSGFDALFLHPSPPSGLSLALPDVDGDAVQILWLTPITAAERALAAGYDRQTFAERLGPHLSVVKRRESVA